MTANLDTRLAGLHSPVLTAFRIVFGLLYTLHGSMKLFGWPVGAAAPVGAWPFWWAGLIEFVLGIMITVGVLTRIAAFIASGEMAFAYFYNHWPPLKGGDTASFWPFDPQMGGNGGELAILYCFAFLLIATTGAGIASVDARRRGAGVGTPARRLGRRDDVVTGTAVQGGRVGRTDRAPRRRFLDRFRR
jgi:putative oxidoreductase